MTDFADSHQLCVLGIFLFILLCMPGFVPWSLTVTEVSKSCALSARYSEMSHLKLGVP